jgi:site-specific DNA-methyltransferase (adenine-specific)
VSVRILIGDCVERMRDLPDNSVDSVVCDPPYHLTSIVKRFGSGNAAPCKAGKTGAYARASRGFMGQTWDGGDVAFRPETWAEVLRVLKPGGHLIAFSGTRTYHRMAVAIEDAGFEVRDMIAWHYGSGFPKSHDVAKAITAQELHGGSNPKALRMARQGEDYAPTGQEDYRKGMAFSAEIEQDRRPTELTEAAKPWTGYGTSLKPATEPICLARKPLSEKSIAANVLKWGTGALNIDGCRIATDEDRRRNAAGGDNGLHGSSTFKIRERRAEDQPITEGRWPANLCHDGSDEVVARFPESESGSMRAGTIRNVENRVYGKGCSAAGKAATEREIEGSSGSAARFFYCAKATTEERGEGNNHPTVKPQALMRWLVRLVTPPGGTVLDPFMGSGSTLIAADAEQFNAIGCEMSLEYAEIARRRITDAAGLFAEVLAA